MSMAEERESSMKKTLKDLCLGNGCSYAVLWHFDPRNHLLLTMEDAYFEEHARSLVDCMRFQVHMLGEGKIGQAAVDGKHRWICVDSPKKGQNAAWVDSDLGIQFSSGIKTVVVIPLELRGVLQFGFTKKILETSEFLDQARRSLLGKDSSVGVAPAGTASSALDFSAADQNGLLASVMSFQSSFHGDLDVSTSLANAAENTGCSWMLDSLPFPGHLDEKSRDRSSDGDLVIDPVLDSLAKDNGDARGICRGRLSNPLDVFEGQFDAYCSPSFYNDSSLWFGDSSKLCVTGSDHLVIDDMLHTFRSDCMSSLVGGNDMFSGVQCEQSAGLSHNSHDNTLNSCGEEKSWDVPLNNDEFFVPQLGIDTDCGKWGECLKDVIYPIADKGNSLPNEASMSISECISGVEGGSFSAPRKGLFSELGLEHLLRGGASTSSITKSSVHDQCTISKKRRIETYQPSNIQTQTGGNSWGVKLVQPANTGVQIRQFGSSKECRTKSQAELWIDDSLAMDAKSCISGVSAPTRRPEEPAKPTKKRARPGESTRPRPKDRQMIADRIKELRDMIPNGAKLSIDALLGRTVKHMLFLQNLTKHSDKLKRLGESKLNGRNKSLVQKDNMTSICSGSSSSSSSRGATWAYEVGGQNLLCPIIVEDLQQPGQMLIEMLCEERGYFLEIADVVRGLGLTILKGTMESRDDKIWAQYIVEGDRHITRMDVFVSLMQILQGSATTVEVARASEPAGMINNGGPSWSNYQQHQHLVAVPLPI